MLSLIRNAVALAKMFPQLEPTFGLRVKGDKARATGNT
jgi:hypothetical protein